MADISALLANAAQTNADFDLGKLNKSYWEGRDQYAKNDLRDAFRPTADNPNGIPMQNGQPDIATMAKTFFQKGDFASGMSLLNQAAAQQDRRDYAGGGGPTAPQQPANTGPPSMSRSAMTPDIAPRNQGGGQPPQAQRQQPTVMTILAAQGIPNDQLEAASGAVSRQLGVGATDPLDPNDPQIRNVLVPAIAQLKRSGIGQVVQNQPQGQSAPMVPTPVQTQAIQPQAPQQGFQPSPDQVAAQNDPTLKRLRFFAGNPDAKIAAAAKEELASYLKNKELTNEEKLARASGQSVPAYQQGQSELATEQAGNTERAKADVVEQRAYIDNAHSARPRLQILNTISNIISSTPNLDLGFGSETSLKIKMALEKAGLDFGDLSGAQLIQKLGAALASESTKALATRPTQFEFKTFLANNPGLSLDEKGNVRMIGIMAQNAKRDVELGVLARRNQNNWDKWDEVVEKYDRKFPITDPTTGKVLSNNSIIAPGISIREPNSGKVLSGAPKQFSSSRDVDAAVASGQLKKGDSFTDPTGKTRYVP